MPPGPTAQVTSEFRQLVSGSRVRLRAHSVFFGTLLLHADIVPSREVALSATDGERVYLNPDAAPRLSTAELDALLLHQVLHAALSHPERRGPREKERWNRAADLVVNGMVAAAGLPLPPTAAREPRLETLSAEEIYAALDGTEGEADGDLLDAAPSDAPAERGQESAGTGTPSPTRQRWQQALAQAQTLAAMSGEPGRAALGDHRDLARLRPAQLDWRSQLWRYLARTPVDFGGFDRRFVGRGLYLEALDEDALEAVVAVDTSGSVDDQQVQALVSEVQGILGAYPHVKATLYYADTEVYGPYPLRPGDPVPEPRGGGGTDFRPFFALPETETADLLIYLSDGYGDFPALAPRPPVLWVVPPGGLDSQQFPFGDVLRLGEDGE
ncbi:VWA-like domain-containing protein [Deinococcus lacus]|uniref:VWA-like domain-containing protein n=1 Tax=Deinococcus lacus TaxID=392561 RepID=A0ABW1YC59_9DEIO